MDKIYSSFEDIMWHSIAEINDITIFFMFNFIYYVTNNIQ